MAKKKQDVAPIVDEEIIEEIPEEIPEEEIIEEEINEEAPEEVPVQKEQKRDEVDMKAFIERKLKVINELPNKAQAKSLAERVLRHREVK